MSLVRQLLKLSPTASLDCWIAQVVDAKGNETFWFKGHDVAAFLGYAKPNKAIWDHIGSDWKKTWRELRAIHSLSTGSENEPLNWQPDALFISEAGLYKLIFRSKIKQVEPFTDWVCNDVMPSLRKNGIFRREIEEREERIAELSNSLVQLNEALVRANQRLARESDDVIPASVVQDLVNKQKSDQRLYTLVVHKVDEKQKMLIFTRCQRRSLSNGLRRVELRYPYATELYRNDFIPSGVNVLKYVKIWLKELKVAFSARNNVVTILDGFEMQHILQFFSQALSPLCARN